MRRNATFLLSLLSLLLIIGFQNCSAGGSRVSFSDQASKSTSSADSGTPYEGKIYATLGDLCPDGTEIHSRIVLSSAVSGVLNREDCQDIAPVSVTSSEFQMNAVTDSLIYKNQNFGFIGTRPLGITNLSASNDVNSFYYSYSYEGTPSWLQIYLDTDNDPTTGYYHDGIGADFLIENDNVWKYSAAPGAPQSTWSWSVLASANKSIVGQTISWSFARATIGSPALFKFMAHTSLGAQSTIVTQVPK